MLLLLPTLLFAHLALRSASPAPDESLAVAPESIQFTFTEPVEVELSIISLIGPAGVVELGSLSSDETRQVVSAPIRGALAAGLYTVGWQAVGRDGHPVRGEYGFRIEDGAEGAASPEPTFSGTSSFSPPSPGAPSMPTFETRSPLYAGVRLMVYLGILGMLGAVGFALLILMRLPAGSFSGGHTLERALLGAASLGVLAALVLLVSLPLRLQAQAHALFGVGISSERFSLLLSSTWGVGWLIQAVGTLAALAGFLLVRRIGPVAWALAAAGTLFVGITPSLSGHAASVEGARTAAMFADGFHVLASGLWLGTLLAILVVGFPVLRHEPESHRGAPLHAMVRSFTPVALLAGAVVVATGLFASWLQLTSVVDLFVTEWGRLLLTKLLFVAVVFAMGAVNWRRVQPRISEPGGDRRLRQAASVELTATLLVLIITSVLTAVPPPAQAGGASAYSETTRDP